LKDLIESGQFKPVIDRTYPLSQIVEAYRYVETGQKIGKCRHQRWVFELRAVAGAGAASMPSGSALFRKERG
jgi:hypothetical protein